MPEWRERLEALCSDYFRAIQGMEKLRPVVAKLEATAKEIEAAERVAAIVELNDRWLNGQVDIPYAEADGLIAKRREALAAYRAVRLAAEEQAP